MDSVGRYLAILLLLSCIGTTSHGAIDGADLQHLEDCVGAWASNPAAAPDWRCVFAHDCTGDNVVDLFDYGVFAGFEGFDSNGTPPPTEWERPPTAYFDVDGDRDLDLFDFVGLQACFATTCGLEGCPEFSATVCLFVYDAHGDREVDLADFITFQSSLGGPAIPRLAQGTASASRFGNPFMFTGQCFDPSTGLYHFWARSYGPQLGRFFQWDPQGALDLDGVEPCCCCGDVPLFHVRSPLVGAGDEYLDAMNLYEYAGSCPIVFIDPTGREYTLANLSFTQGIEAMLFGALGSTIGVSMAASQPLQWGVTGLGADVWDLFVDATEAAMVGSFMVAERLYTAIEQATANAQPIPLARSPGMCEFYLQWCEWGNGRPPGDKGTGWKRNAPCLQCYSTCKTTGRWPFTQCPIGGYPRHRWPRPNDPWKEPVLPTPGEY